MHVSKTEKLIKVKKLDRKDVHPLHRAFSSIGWDKPVALFEKYLEEQHTGTREVLVAYVGEHIVGYGTLMWQSHYPYLAERDIPEINDLNVLPKFRKQGIATSILDKLESLVAKNHETVGIGFGLYKDYGAAQSLYIKRGYLPNKEGITYNYKNVVPGESYLVDDDLVLWFVKELH